MKRCGARAYRFSISWSRVIPLGGRDDPLNGEGIIYYQRLVEDLLAAGIVPLVTLFHWDLPEELYRRYDGFLNQKEFVADFVRYARVMFTSLPRVRHWITFNEPHSSAINGYNQGFFAPGHTSDREVFHRGDSAREPWVVGHSMLVAHGETVKIFRSEFKHINGGEIGITLNGRLVPVIAVPMLTVDIGDWAEPWDVHDPEDVKAAERRLEFYVGWFGDPIYFGNYPASMRSQLGDRLPEFSPEESALIQGSNDFYGMNHYTSNYIKHKTGAVDPNDFVGHSEVLMENNQGQSIGPSTASSWLRPNAPGFRKLLKWISDRYQRPKIYVTENGTSISGENDKPRDEILNDDFRLHYFETYIHAMAEAVAQDNVDCRAYMAWSLME